MTKHRPHRVRIGLRALAILATMGLAAPALAQDQHVPVIGLEADVPTLDPIIDNTLSSVYVYRNLYDQLLEIKADGELAPRLATAWSSNADATQWTFTLRDDATFQNGAKVTPEDVTFTFKQVLDNPDSRIKTYARGITNMEVTDGKVVFTLGSPNVNFPRDTALVSIVPAKYYTDKGAAGFAQAPIGSGPFRFESRTASTVTLVANPDYWGGEPKLHEVKFATVSTDDARMNGIQSGSLDIVVVPAAQADSLASSNVDIRSVVSNKTVFLGLNARAGILAKPEVRRAVSIAIDRQKITDVLLAGKGAPAAIMSSPAVFGYSKFDPIPYDPEKAKQLLTDAGYDNTPVELTYALSGKIPSGVDVAQAVGGYLETAGFTVKLDGVDANTFRDEDVGQRFPGIYLSTFSPLNLDASIVLDFYIGPKGRRYFDDPAVDAAIVAQYAATDPDKRRELIGKVWKLVNDNTYFIPLYNPVETYAVNPALVWEPRADGSFDMRTAHYKD
jgi:peptide/nickel transport system substrate-binding protein